MKKTIKILCLGIALSTSSFASITVWDGKEISKNMRAHLSGNSKLEMDKVTEAVQNNKTTWAESFIRFAIELCLESLNADKTKQVSALEKGNDIFAGMIGASATDVINKSGSAQKHKTEPKNGEQPKPATVEQAKKSEINPNNQNQPITDTSTLKLPEIGLPGISSGEVKWTKDYFETYVIENENDSITSFEKYIKDDDNKEIIKNKFQNIPQPRKKVLFALLFNKKYATEKKMLKEIVSEEDFDPITLTKKSLQKVEGEGSSVPSQTNSMQTIKNKIALKKLESDSEDSDDDEKPKIEPLFVINDDKITIAAASMQDLVKKIKDIDRKKIENPIYENVIKEAKHQITELKEKNINQTWITNDANDQLAILDMMLKNSTAKP